MKPAAIALVLVPGVAIASSWTSQELPAFKVEGTGRFVSHVALTKSTRPLILSFDQ